MQLDETSRVYQKALSTNATDSSFASKIATVIEPSGNGVVQLVPQGSQGIVPVRMLMVPYGLGSSNDAFDMKVIGWRHIKSSVSSLVDLWIPATIGEYACTVGAGTGVAGTPVLATELFVDTITAKSSALIPKKPGYDATPAAVFSSDTVIYSPADDTLAYVIMPLYGFEKVEFVFDQTTNTPSMNCVIALL